MDNKIWHFVDPKDKVCEYCGNDEDGSYDNAMDAKLVTPQVTLGDSPVLSFSQWFEGEYDGRAGYEDYYWDGGVVDISTDDGASFSRITPIGGYPYKITPNPDSPFPADTPCLAGTGGWETVSFDLAAYAGKPVRIRFRFGSDHYTVARGWFIDDIRLDWQNGWAVMNTESGLVAAATSDDVGVTVSAAGMSAGSYGSSLTLISNDPVTPLLNVPAMLHILSATGGSDIGFDAESGGFVVSWPADSRHSYTLSTNTNLTRGVWQVVPGYDRIPGVDGTMSYTGMLDNISSIYYRIDEE